MTQSPNLQAIAKLTTPAAQVQQLILTYLSRLPSAAENTAAVAYPVPNFDDGEKRRGQDWRGPTNKLEFVFSY